VSQPGTLIRHPLAIAGALITTASAVVFIALLIAALIGWFDNPYAGLIVFVALPALFVLGLLLIPAGIGLQRRKLARHPETVQDWPVFDFRLLRVRRFALLITALTALNIVIVLVAGYGSLHYMESPNFCGATCHTPMQPQFTAWQEGAHARIACVNCHVGAGARGFVHAKLAGTRQLAQVITGGFPRPIPPGAELAVGDYSLTCGRCHQPMNIPGDVIRVKREYADDEANSETMTILLMHVGRANESKRAIHWHADPATRIEFASADPERQTINYVKVTDAKGQVKEYFAPDAGDHAPSADQLRLMDCVACHNMVGHRIAPTPEQSVDAAIAADEISRTLPFARREGVRLLKASYASEDAALQGIEQELRRFYSSQQGGVDDQAVRRAVAALQGAYRRNNFPAMKVTWGTYPDNSGHITAPGCFRCHDGSHTAKDGSTINADCESCHRQVERP
jgi:NapC/NirT cytochrome c family, N-terminal region